MKLKIHRASNGTVVGAGPLWIPGSFLQPFIKDGQKEIELSFGENFIQIKTKEATGAGTPAAQTEHRGGAYGSPRTQTL